MQIFSIQSTNFCNNSLEKTDLVKSTKTSIGNITNPFANNKITKRDIFLQKINNLFKSIIKKIKK